MSHLSCCACSPADRSVPAKPRVLFQRWSSAKVFPRARPCSRSALDCVESGKRPATYPPAAKILRSVRLRRKFVNYTALLANNNTLLPPPEKAEYVIACRPIDGVSRQAVNTRIQSRCINRPQPVRASRCRASSTRTAGRILHHIRSVFPNHRAMLEPGARAPPRCGEAVHSRLPNAQAISDCSYSAHQAPRSRNSTLADLVL